MEKNKMSCETGKEMEPSEDSEDDAITEETMAKWLQPDTRESKPRWERRAKLQTSGFFGSHGFYNNLLADAMKDVRHMLAEEKVRASVAYSDRRKMFQAILDVYFRYLKIYKSMDEIYDQMVHPQKRIIVRKILDLLIGRLLELQFQLVLCENSEICYFDELALVEGVIPKELDVPIPKYYYHDPTPDVVQRDQWFLNVEERERREQQKEEEMQRKLMLKMKEEAEAIEWGIMATDMEETFDDTVLPVQVMERGRQGKGRYLVGKFYYDEEQRLSRKKVAVVVQRLDENEAATVIQKLVRGFLARHRVKRIRNTEMEFLGIRPTTVNYTDDFDKDYFFRFNVSKWKENENELEMYKEGKRKLRKTRQRQLEEAQVMIYQKLHTLEGPDLAESFKYKIRTWMLNVREVTGKFPDIPKGQIEESSFIIDAEKIADEGEEEEEGMEVTDSEGAQKTKGNKKQKEEKVKAKPKAKAKKGGVPENPSLEPLKCIDELKEANLEYNKHWRGLTDNDNPDQDIEMDHIVREKREEVSLEIREQVDVAMKAELDYLKQVLEKRKGKKGKKGKGKGKGKGKSKKGKKKKGKDLTPDRTMESLFEELVQQNIIRKYPLVRLDDLIGQCSFVNGELRTYHTAHPFEKKTEERYMPGDANPLPAYGDVLRAVKNVCILPMGSTEVHKMTPCVAKSVLICGPPGSGKKTIVNMICTELRASLIDLTSGNIAGKYPGKPGLKMLMHLIEKVGRAVQPVIVLIDNCEKTYMKKVPKTDKTEPKRLKKQIGKFLKVISSEDLILLIGLSSEPWLCPFKVMKKDYQRVLYIPPADYGTRFDMWKRGLNGNLEMFHPDINFTLLTKLSHGWTGGYIKRACDDMVQRHQKEVEKQQRERRKDMDPWSHLGNFVIRPVSIGRLLITVDKLIDSIGEYDPVFLEQEKLWNNWWNKTSLQKARLSSQVKAAPEKKKDKKGKKKGKKKK